MRDEEVVVVRTVPSGNIVRDISSGFATAINDGFVYAIVLKLNYNFIIGIILIIQYFFRVSREDLRQSSMLLLFSHRNCYSRCL